MKSFEELESMTVSQLKGIAQGLGVNVPSNIAKPKLVQLVYDVQQPDPKPEDEAEKPADEEKEITTQADFDAKLKEIADFFDGEIEVTDEEVDGAKVFIVKDPVADAEVIRGTFTDLYEHVQTKTAEAQNEAAGIEQEDGDDTGFKEVSLSDDTEAQDHSTPPMLKDDNMAEIVEGIKPLIALGLKYTVNGSVIKFSKGLKSVSTTLNQPPHRVVRVAENLCNFA